MKILFKQSLIYTTITILLFSSHFYNIIEVERLAMVIIWIYSLTFMDDDIDDIPYFTLVYFYLLLIPLAMFGWWFTLTLLLISLAINSDIEAFTND